MVSSRPGNICGNQWLLHFGPVLKWIFSWHVKLGLPSGYVKIATENDRVEIVDLSIENGDFP
jgi:hypothetical protein